MKTKNTLKDYIIGLPVLALIGFGIYSCQPDPIGMSHREISDAYEYVRASDKRIRSVHINKDTGTLVFTRADIGLNLDVVAKSWCNEFPEIKYVHIYGLLGKKHLGKAGCR